ncbi:MAG: hypothetical protein ACRD1X_20445 [Vicinamibacteria bacterium]
MRLIPTTRASAIVVFSIIAFLAACSTPEEQLVNTFLTAVRDGQEDMIRGVSLVDLPETGIQSWEIIEVGLEATEPYRLAELRKAFFDATQAWESKVDDNDKFVNDNREETLRYRKEIGTDPGYKFPSGAMAEYQEEWETREAAAKELEEKVREADEALKKERDSVYMSANMAVRDGFEGDVTVKTVRVNVNGGSGSKTYALTLRKYNVVDSETGITPMSRWIVTDIEG